MFKIFSKVIQAITANANASETAIWVRDPMSHPDIEAMDSRALGDLPFGLFRQQGRTGDTASCCRPV